MSIYDIIFIINYIKFRDINFTGHFNQFIYRRDYFIRL